MECGSGGTEGGAGKSIIGFVLAISLVRVPVQVFPDSGQPGAAPIQVDEDTLRRAIASILALRGTIQLSANRSVLEVILRDSRVSDDDLKRLNERSVLQTLDDATRSPSLSKSSLGSGLMRYALN